MPLSVIMRDVLEIAQSGRVLKYVLREQDVLVSGRKVRRLNDTAGLMDVVSFPATSSHFRVLMNELETLYLVPINGAEVTLLPCKVSTKTVGAGGTMRLGFHNGRTLVVKDGKHKVGDTVMLSLDGKTSTHVPLAIGATVLVTQGKHVGKRGTVEKLADAVKGTARVVTADGAFETKRHYLFVLGTDKLLIKV